MTSASHSSVISKLLSNTAERERPVAYCQGRYLTREDFENDIGALREELDHRRELRWGVFMGDTYCFGVTLLALLASGKAPVILPNVLPSFIDSIRGELDALICDKRLRGLSLPCLQALPEVATGPRQSRLPELDARRSGIVLFTSGSTGEPKGIPKSLLQLEKEVEVLEGLWGDHLADSVILSSVTHQHIYGLLFSFLWPLASGRCFDSVIYNDPWSFLRQTRQFARVALISSPAQLTRLPDALPPGNLPSNVTMVFSSGGPFPRPALKTFRQRFGFGVCEVFGSTETGGIASRSQLDEDPETPWKPLPSVSIKCKPGGNSLVIRSPFEGSGQWYTTADTVELLSDNAFLLKGRSDNIVKVGEKRLSLTEVEDRLVACDLVVRAAAAVQEGQRATVVVALVLSDKGTQFLRLHSKRELEAHLKGYLLQYFEPVVLPKKWRYVEDLPYNSQGKPTHAAILELFAPAGRGLGGRQGSATRSKA